MERKFYASLLKKVERIEVFTTNYDFLILISLQRYISNYEFFLIKPSKFKCLQDHVTKI